MQKKNVLLLLLLISMYACKKTTSTCVSTGGVPTAAEIASVKSYLDSKGIVATKDSLGYYYNVLSVGYGPYFPNSLSTITINYKGSLTNGVVFDSTSTGVPRSFQLNSLVLGWQYGIPKIKKSGAIDLYLPPSLGYGCTSSSTIPANSILIFHIELLDY